MTARTIAPHVRALVAALEACPPRKEAEPAFERWLAKRMSEELRALLEAWSRHVPRDLAVGRFRMDDRCLRRSFELPVWEKDGPGPEDGCVWNGACRDDVLVLGEVGAGVLVVEFWGDEVRDDPVVIEGWNHVRSDPTLERWLAWEHAHAAESVLGKWLD